MAVEHYCDYCGQLIEGQSASIELGHSPLWMQRVDYDFCAGTREDHADSCIEQARRVLDQMRGWAHRGEGSPLEWTLTERPGSAAPDPSPEAPVAQPSKPVRGTLYVSQWVTHGPSDAALTRGGVRTLEEAAELTEYDLLAMESVGADTVGRLKEAMSERGLSFREGPTAADVGGRIRELREAAAMRRQELADAIDPGTQEPGDRFRRHDVHGGIVAAWERGTPCPREWLAKIAGVFGVPVEQFLDVRAA